MAGPRLACLGPATRVGQPVGRSVAATPAQYPAPPAELLLHNDCTANLVRWLPVMLPIAPGIGITFGSPGIPPTSGSPTHAHLSPFSLASNGSYQPPRFVVLVPLPRMSSAPGSVTVSSISCPSTIDSPSSLPALPLLTAFSPQTFAGGPPPIGVTLIASTYGMFV